MIAPSITPLSPFQVRTAQLCNGINILRGEQDSDLLRIDIVFPAGQYRQSKQLQAMFTMLMLREGCASMTEQQISQRLEYYGARLDLSLRLNNAQLTLVVLKQHAPNVIETLIALITTPTFPQERLDILLQKHKTVFLVDREKVASIAGRELRRQMFTDKHPLGLPVELEDYDSVTTDDLTAFYQQYFQPSSIYLSGAVDEDIITLLSQLPTVKEPAERAPVPEAYCLSPSKRFIDKANVQQNAVLLGWHTPSATHPDSISLQVAMTVLGGYFGSRLMNTVREQHGYTYGIYAATSYLPDSGLSQISCQTAPQYTEGVLIDIHNEIERLQQEPVPEQELSRVRNYMLGEAARQYEGTFSLLSSLISYHQLSLPTDYPEQYMKTIASITPARLQAIARQYLTPTATVVVGCPSHG